MDGFQTNSGDQVVSAVFLITDIVPLWDYFLHSPVSNFNFSHGLRFPSSAKMVFNS